VCAWCGSYEAWCDYLSLGYSPWPTPKRKQASRVLDAGGPDLQELELAVLALLNQGEHGEHQQERRDPDEH